jgi:hypothetical protein
LARGTGETSRRQSALLGMIDASCGAWRETPDGGHYRFPDHRDTTDVEDINVTKVTFYRIYDSWFLGCASSTVASMSGAYQNTAVSLPKMGVAKMGVALRRMWPPSSYGWRARPVWPTKRHTRPLCCPEWGP